MPMLSAYRRVDEYLAQLPQGAASFPECQAKAAICHSILDSKPLDTDRAAGAPAVVLQLARERPPVSAWVPEVHLMLLSLTVADHYQMSDDVYLIWLHQQNRKLLEGPLYRMLLSFLSPGQLLRAASMCWGAMHRGTSVSIVEMGKSEVTAKLSFPAGLYNDLLLETYARAFKGALEMSRVERVEVRVKESGPSHGLYIARWRA